MRRKWMAIDDEEAPLFRPPGEAGSVIVRVAQGCPWNGCTFCGMYKGVQYAVRPLEEVEKDLRAAARDYPAAQRLFLADGDVMGLPWAYLEAVLREACAVFRRLARISMYANGRSIQEKDDAVLEQMRGLKVHTLYMGLESGDDELLRMVNKRESAGEMIAACQRAQAAGLRMSVMVLLGLGGTQGSAKHAERTAVALNAMQPRVLSVLRCMPIPGTAWHAAVHSGAIRELSEADAVAELRAMIAELELARTVFRANHVSNVFPLEGRFAQDKARMLAELDALLASGRLDTRGPGPRPLFL